MNNLNIRLLRADEIECRVAMVKKTQYGYGCSLLLYKDARCDMNILDEIFGPLGWERSHQVVNNSLFCTVSVFDEVHNRWINKQDVGTESNTEKEKGQASDSFKRACFNLGIGRELYTAPFIWVNLSESEVRALGNDKYSCYAKFIVTEVMYSEKKITGLKITDEKGNVRYTLNVPGEAIDVSKGKAKETDAENSKAAVKESAAQTEAPTEEPKAPKTKKLTEKQVARLFAIAKSKGYTEAQVVKAAKACYQITDIHDLQKKDYDDMCKGYEKAAPKK